MTMEMILTDRHGQTQTERLSLEGTIGHLLLLTLPTRLLPVRITAYSTTATQCLSVDSL